MTITYLQIASFAYIFLISIIFLSTKKTITLENKLYSSVVIFTMLATLIDIIKTSLSVLMPEQAPVIIFFEKTYMVFIVWFVLYFTEYSIVILNKQLSSDQKLKEAKKNKIIIQGLILVISIVIFLAPSGGGVTLTGKYGIDAYISAGIFAISVIIWIMIAIKHRKTLDKKTLVPIIIYIVVTTTAALVQFTIPTLHVISTAAVFTVIVMYFTIFTMDNPDVKLIEEITAARTEAEKANQSKTQFLADMSHEIRTPLNAILGFSQGLLEEEIPDNAKDDVEDIISASDSLLDIVNEILDISKIETNKLEILNGEYSFNKVYKYLVSLTEGRIGSKPLQFIHECDDKIPEVLYGDSTRIRQIAVNLITNSVKYTKEGFVKLNVKYEPIDNDSCYLVITVEDSGIGIKQENLDKLFSEFQRFDLKKNINIEGTGLGLALTKRLIDLMEGEIKVESRYGEGSKFIVKIKQKIIHKSINELEETNVDSRQRFIGNGEKILLVDDNNVNLKVACRLLKKYKLQIETCNSGKECIERVANNQYDLIMLDDLMPGMSGVETLKYLQQQPNFNIPTVALTANAISGMKEKYLKDGFNDYLSKPIDKGLLEEVLVKFLGGPVQDNQAPITENKEVVEVNTQETQPVPVEEVETLEIETLDTEEKKIPVVNQMPEEIPQAPVETPSENKAPETGNEKGNVEYLKSNGVDIDAALELLGDMEMYDETVNDFCQEVDQKIADIKKFHDAQDMPNYAILVHSLKSDSKYIGLMHLAELAYNHEMASKGNDVDFVNKNYDELMQEADKMISIIKKYAGV